MWKTCYNGAMERKHGRREQSVLVFAASPGIRNDLARPDEAAIQLQHYLSAVLGMNVEVIIDDDYEDILAGLERGVIDVAKLGPYAFALAQARFGAHALVNVVDAATNGTSPYPYRSIIFTRAGGNITHLTQLKQQKFGFVDPHSTTGYLIATFLLEQAGIDSSTDLEAVFLGSHPAVAEAVFRKEVAAGAIMEEEFLRSAEEKGRHAFRPLAMSPLLSRGPIVVRSHIPRSIERTLLHTLEQLHETNLDCFKLLKSPTQRFVAAPQREKTLKSIAELAGVSYATVSRAINGRDRIAPGTTARVLKLVEELGYRPNANARSLHKTKGDFVGLLLPSLRYPELDDIVEGIQSILDAVHLQLLLCPVGQSGSQRQQAYVEMFSNSRFEGVLLTQWSARDHGMLELLMRNGRPYVLIEQEVYEEGLRTVWNWLEQQGHRRIGLVTSDRALLESALTHEVCTQLAAEPVLWKEATTTSEEWEVLLRQPDAPSALLCTDEQTALALHERLAPIGPHLLVVGIGASSPCVLPRLTFDGEQLGRAAALRLLKMLNVQVPVQQAEPCLRIQTEETC